MMDIKEIDKELYYQRYIKKDFDKLNKLWGKVKGNKELLEEAIKLTKNKFGEDTLKSLIICECMLITYDKVDSEVYQKLVNIIYSNEKIARKVLDGASNGGYSFLLYTLFNQNLKLTEEQKQFAVSEAMNKTATKKYVQQQKAYSKKLDEVGITDEMIVTIGHGKDTNPIGAKAGCEYMHSFFYGLRDSQCHGIGAFDIRYHILRNSNWTIEEKKQLLYDFYYDDKTYDEFLDEWCWNIINYNLYREGYSFALENWYLFDYKYEDILDLSQNKEVANEVWNEINFCRTMHNLRTPSHLKKEDTPVLKRTINN